MLRNTSWALVIAALACTMQLPRASASSKIGCFDEDGRPVDWYMGYKFPKLKGEENFGTGHAYAYITNKDVGEPQDDDIATRVEDKDSLIFLQRFKDLLLKFGGSFLRKSSQNAQTKGRVTRLKKKLQTKSNSNWIASEKLISDPSSVIMRTLAPAYDEKLFSRISSVFYNDDPDKTSATSDDDESTGDSDNGSPRTIRKKKKYYPSNAHAKGVFLMDQESNTGVWLTHSIPKFPNVRDHTLEFPDSGRLYGQTFMCISFDLREDGPKLVDHLINMKPIVYDRMISDSLLKQIPNLEYLDLKGNYKRMPNSTRLAQTITTKSGQILKLYSKAPSINEDIYSSWIDEDLGTDLYVETWRRGSGGSLNSLCPSDDYHINNVKDLKYNSELNWGYLNDHSKWAISDQKDYAIVCIGDANRMQSQFTRGSGAVCIKCPTCWSIFSNTILDTEPCPKRAIKGLRRKQTIDKSLKERVAEYLEAVDP